MGVTSSAGASPRSVGALVNQVSPLPTPRPTSWSLWGTGAIRLGGKSLPHGPSHALLPQEPGAARGSLPPAPAGWWQQPLAGACGLWVEPGGLFRAALHSGLAFSPRHLLSRAQDDAGNSAGGRCSPPHTPLRDPPAKALMSLGEAAACLLDLEEPAGAQPGSRLQTKAARRRKRKF